MLRTILGWLTGPLTALGTMYMESKNSSELAQIEREVKKDFLHKELATMALDDDLQRQRMVEAIISDDRGDARTSWIRPLTAALAILFWLALTLSQIVWVGYGNGQLLPVVWNVPPGALGQVFTAFPLGVLASFYISRPIEKFLLGAKR